MTDPIDIISSQKDSRELMEHQKRAIDALDIYFKLSEENLGPQNGLLVMPTGSGKTFTAVNWLLDRGVANGYRIVWLTHRQELIDQTNIEFRSQAPILANYEIKKLKVIPVSGIHFHMSQASRYDINIISIQSIANKYGFRFIRRMLGSPGLEKLIVVVDEAHHAVSPSYNNVLKRITDLNPNRILLGLTATPKRMREEDNFNFQKRFYVDSNKKNKIGTVNGYVYEVTLNKLIKDEFLAIPKYQRIETNIIGDVEFDISKEDEDLFNRFGELTEHIKDQIAKSSSRNKLILKQYLEGKEKYGKTIIFAVNQLHCKTLYREFDKAGISCDYVISDKPGAQQTIADFKANKFKVLINVQILTEGSDVPDIQTVFLTRQTNSDSLLMQMIGRGLRGPKAGGTKEVYIIDFHDTWEKFHFWMDPTQLDIFNLPVPAESVLGEEKKAGTDNEGEIIVEVPDASLWDLYVKIYEAMKANIISKKHMLLSPVGWYSLLDDEGQDEKILVYENQLNGFKRLKNNKDVFINKNADASIVSKMCFDDDGNIPQKKDLQLILNTLYESKEMPDYYSFEERDLVNIKEIARKMNELSTTDIDKEEWLKDIFEKSLLLKELFKTFYVFKKTILEADKEITASVINSLDERANYHIEEGIYNLEELMEEVLTDNEFLNKDNLLSISWSNVVVKSWYGLCQWWQFEDGSYEYRIQINKLLSSPEVSREVIKYLIYHELLHKNGYHKHDMAFRELEWNYPESDELDGFLDELVLRYNLDIPLRAEQYDNDEKISGVAEGILSGFEIIPNQEEEESKKEDGLLINIVGKYCRNCGNKLPVDANFCDKCGNNTNY
ncbi:MAG: DEAD/DEAH box helicase family protein [Bacteroidales bacterium]